MSRIRATLIKLRMKLFPRFAKKYDMNFILQESGISVGKGTIFYGPETMQIDRSRPYLLSIGEYCKIASGVTILTHDYSRSVLRRAYGDVIESGRPTTIGNNVFIGMNSIVLMGAQIGDNVIVGAGSVVSGTIPSNVVVGGNPAKIIRSLEEHYKIKKDRMLSDAKECVIQYVKKYNRRPSMNEIGAFWPLFIKRSREDLMKSGANWHLNGDEPEEIMKAFIESDSPVFESYDDFLNYCLEDGVKE